MCDINQTLCDLLHYTKAELAGLKFEHLLAIPGKIFFQTHFFPMLKMQGKAEEIFMMLISKKKSEVPVLINAVRDAENPPVYVCVALHVHNRRKYEEEILEAKRKATKALFENEVLEKAKEEAFMYAKDADRQITRLNRVNEDLRQFSNIVNHDMQECIRKINTFTILAETEKAEEYLARIRNAAQRLKIINSSLNIFIQLGAHAENFRKVDLNSVVEQSKMEVLRSTGFTNLNFSSEQLPVIDGIAKQLELLFFHLILNAVKFRKGDSVTVTIKAVVFEENRFKNTANRYSYGEVVKIVVSDNGIGFDEQYNKYVMNIFRKMKVHSGGSGIGLALCKKVVDNHYGEISLKSKENEGTEVTVLLPVKQDPVRNTNHKSEEKISE